MAAYGLIYSNTQLRSILFICSIWNG